MNPYQYIEHYPHRSKLLLGIEFHQFHQLRHLAESAYHRDRAEQQQRQTRLIALGGGRPAKLTPAEQICLTLLYLRQLPTFEVLGLLFGVSKSQANATFHQWLGYLRTLLPASLLEQVAGADDGLAWLQEELSELELLVDSTEQPRYRPKDTEAQRRCYSGKKHQHTYKNQLISLPEGRDIVDVVVGERGPEADITLLRTQQKKFVPGQGFGGDKAYVGAPRTRTPHKKPRKQALTEAQREANRAFARERIAIEHLMRVLKIFRIAQQRFRGAPSTYREIILTVCGLVRLRLGMLILPISSEA